MKTAWFLSIVCLMSVAAFSQQVSTVYDRGTNFSNYKTYAWGTNFSYLTYARGTASPQPINDPLWNQRMMETVDGALAAKGMQKVNLDQNPSVIVGYSVATQRNVSYQGYALIVWRLFGARVVETKGTLVVDFADPQTKVITWRGIATETLSDKSQKNTQKLQKMVSKMFQKYPPSN